MMYFTATNFVLQESHNIDRIVRHGTGIGKMQHLRNICGNIS